MMFNGCVCHYTRITCHGKSAVKLAIGKATEVRRVYLVRNITGASGLSSTWCYSYGAQCFFLGVL